MSTNFTSNDSNLEQTNELLKEQAQLSSGNSRLAIIAGAILLLAGTGYAFVPAKTTHKVISSVMPSVMLGDATVTGTRPVDEEPVAAQEPSEAEADKPAATVASTPKATAKASPAKLEAPEPLAPNRPEHALEPVVAAAAPTAEAAAETPAAPANVTLTGRILDDEGAPLAGATVFLKGSKKGTSTDANGNYALEVPTGENTLSYGYAGYYDKEIRLHNATPTTVSLQPREDAKPRRRK